MTLIEKIEQAFEVSTDAFDRIATVLYREFDIDVSNLHVLDYSTAIQSLQVDLDAPSPIVLRWDDDGFYNLDWDGEGTEDSPYILRSAEDFAGMAYRINTHPEGMNVAQQNEYVAHWRTAHYRLVNNIDLRRASWLPMGALGVRGFQGVFDGGMNQITMPPQILQSAGTSNVLQGLWAEISAGAVVENIILRGHVAYEAVERTGWSYHAPLVANIASAGGAIRNIINLSSSSVRQARAAGSSYGGILGRVESSGGLVIQNVVNYGTVTVADARYLAGIVGEFTTGATASRTLINCHNRGNISATVFRNNLAQAGIGGVVGALRLGQVNFINCINTGTVSVGRALNTTNYSASAFAGIIGAVYSTHVMPIGNISRMFTRIGSAEPFAVLNIATANIADNHWFFDENGVIVSDDEFDGREVWDVLNENNELLSEDLSENFVRFVPDADRIPSLEL